MLLAYPAEAASPPPLSAFRSPRFTSDSSPTSILSQTLPSNLFSDIERQLSAKLAVEPLPRPLEAHQPTPPTYATSDQSSPPEPPSATAYAASPQSIGPVLPSSTTAHCSLVATEHQKPPQESATSRHSAATDRPTPPRPSATSQRSLEVLVKAEPPQQRKDIDAFFAALTSAHGSGGAACESKDQKPSALSPYSTTEQNCNNPPELRQTQPLSTGASPHAPLAQSFQQAANNALAANLLVNALAAQRHQQQLQHHPANSVAAASDASTNLLASFKTLPTAASPLFRLNDGDSGAAMSNAFSSGAMALSALQLVQQTTAQLQQHNQQLQPQVQSTTGPTASKSPANQHSPELRVPTLLNHFPTLPNNLHASGPGSSHSKPIPVLLKHLSANLQFDFQLLGERMDLLRFKRKEPREWSSDDVVAWILDVARRHQIPCK